jgi:hypothetical protein
LTLDFEKWTRSGAKGKCLERNKKESYEILGEGIIENSKCIFEGLNCVFNDNRVRTTVLLDDRNKVKKNSDNHVGRYPLGGKIEECEWHGKVECIALELSFDIPRTK